MPIARRIRLSHAYSRFVGPSADGSRLVVRVDVAEGIDRAVFAYRAIPAQPGDASGEARATFSHVCSPVDMAEYPAGSPYPDASPPWFRLESADLLFRSRAQAAEGLRDIEAEVRGLLAALLAMDLLGPAASAWLGSTPPAGYVVGRGNGIAAAAVGGRVPGRTG